MKHKPGKYIWFSLACLAWFILRVGARPTRIVYPCQRVAAAQSGWFLYAFLAPAFVAFWKGIKTFFLSTLNLL